MILTSVGALTLALGLVSARPAFAQTHQQSRHIGAGAGPSTISETVTASGTISAIDKQARKVTIQGPEGKQILVTAPPDADLGRLRVGDKVDVEYHRALAVKFQPPGTPMAGPTEQTSAQRTAGGRAGTREVSVVAEVVAVDPSRNEVTFRGPRGNLETIAVQDPAMQEKARQLKPGDKVEFTYTEAAAVAIRPMKQQQPSQQQQQYPKR